MDSLEKAEASTNQLPDTELSVSIDKLMFQWTQLLSQIQTTVGIVQPTDDHIKESAEIVVRQFKDACLDASGEFARTALEWRIRHPEIVLEEEINDLQSSITRQHHLLNKISERTGEILKNE